ncbi:SpoIIE family protein phosphatase [Streptomyces sp. NPDC058773]|uniref:SpoIIE family protein phosphatase n=1 Tax=Streptomyces sp. NPDC058773 TaxID=3346632 RepID=UPI0036A1965F
MVAARARRSGRGGRTGSRSVLSVHSVVGQMFLLQLAVIVLLCVGAAFALVIDAQHAGTHEASRRSLSVAESVAHAPGIEAAMRSRDPTAVLQPRAEAIRVGSGVDFVVVVNRDGIRYTHPKPNRIGKHFSADLTAVMAGQTKTETTKGTLGPQVRASVPIRDPQGRVIGAVVAGITTKSVSGTLNRQVPVVLAAAAAAMAVTTGGAAVLSRRLLRQTHGLGPAEITRLYEHHDAVLHSVREGVLIIDEDRRLLLANDEARRLLDLPADAEGRHVDALGLAPRTAALLASGRPASDELHSAGDRLLAVNQRPTGGQGRPEGTVATLRDSTELHALSGKTEAARTRLNVMYEGSVRIGSTLDVTRTAQELAEAAVPRFADFVTVDLAEPVLRGEEPHGTPMTLRRTATVGIRDDHPLYPTGERITFRPSTPQARGMTAGGARIEPDLRTAHGWQAQDPERARRMLDYGIHSLIAAPLYARGLVVGVANFWRSERTAPFEDDDLALAEELCARAAVCIDNARRYAREHHMAVALQRSLLPRSLPAQSALDVAYRYLPAQAGVGGDWFDVIPLSGARVALVVGDVVGHGVQASVTMGRLRTAVRTLADIDLPPDELLTHFDDIVLRLAAEAATESGVEADGSRLAAPGDVGATCLYAVYDPVSRHCSLARAGHPTPAVVTPDGRAHVLDVPPGPPLGLGGLPFEAVEVDLPEGSLLALFTDGLIETRGRDPDEQLELLCSTLARPAASVEAVCDNVLDALPPPRPDDDIALLVARTHALGDDRVASWDVPSDPAVVARTRRDATAQLTAWGLHDAVFTTELVVSELVTNAIRYGQPPIQLRLIHDRSLICEVSDSRDTAPHLRRARVFDEGGRGLLLVAQLTQRWGTRHARRGKTIWAEQDLTVG